MKKLTTFQIKCEDKAMELLSRHGIVLQNRNLGGESEIYIHARLKDTEIWIYEDEAMIYGNGKDIRFESPDYDTEDQLIEAFISGLKSVLNSD